MRIRNGSLAWATGRDAPGRGDGSHEVHRSSVVGGPTVQPARRSLRASPRTVGHGEVEGVRGEGGDLAI